MKTLNSALRHASAFLTARTKTTGATVRVCYGGPTSWTIEAFVPEWAPRGKWHLEVLGLGSTLPEALAAFRQAAEQAHPRHLRKVERERRKVGR